ncbi:hypothetical protein BV25DRAFT_1905453 [Artomyces pyxidatus]|uniref:Uncharacterized protein n=1 Tax=Artomyces pyxidatus TaxID=48021 RepID=A0ACB8TF20_9AGAM|nr:hypothetical protein BV25DRAFT_1905453 [Artomyces pyxidatus]
MSQQALNANNEGAALSLLSLSIAAANATPISVSSDATSAVHTDDEHASGGANVTAPLSTSSGPAVQNGLKHRRLSSVGQMKRRMSDARDAATRPSPVGLQTAAATLSALASLSLSSSPPSIAPKAASYLSLSAPMPIPITLSKTFVDTVSVDESDGFTGHSPSSSALLDGIHATDAKNGGVGAKTGKKRGTIFTCESCSKIYRHPSCLIKHRWEHTPHWREASKFLLSKHQQVQLMEAAAILSHLSPGQSLPDDRSLWPSFLSGGALPPPSAPSSLERRLAAHPTSSSVPGPRLHDFAIGTGAITRLRPGVVGVPTGSAEVRTHEFAALDGSPASAQSYSAGGWSLPRLSASSRSRSVSDDSEDADLDMEMDSMSVSGGFSARGRMSAARFGTEELSVKEEEEHVDIDDEGWDGMDMDMEL